ncbi:unnamed protein product [Brassica oleracea var. botrytis]|uniref:(rape) hypothetical protein n=1 Tax=Brassica napus TaxID=3708 RepID=A0A816JR24_BRANA|nr:unnamed protein product [Brassica napus]
MSFFSLPPPMTERQIQLVFGDAMRGRSNELCRPYAEALLNLCREINVKRNRSLEPNTATR